MAKSRKGVVGKIGSGIPRIPKPRETNPNER